MLDRTYPGQVCSVARALEVVGERWSLLILRDALFGFTRFEDFRSRLGIASNVLTARLERLVDEGLLERRLYQEHPERFEYVLTEKGRGLGPALMRLMKWGDEHYPSPAGPPPAAAQPGGVVLSPPDGWVCRGRGSRECGPAARPRGGERGGGRPEGPGGPLTGPPPRSEAA